eukprot:1194732-Prorocentrum_minimum.AAC.4
MAIGAARCSRRKLPCPHGRVVGSPRWAAGVPGEPRGHSRRLRRLTKEGRLCLAVDGKPHVVPCPLFVRLFEPRGVCGGDGLFVSTAVRLFFRRWKVG